jgi:hypothetical protein
LCSGHSPEKLVRTLCNLICRQPCLGSGDSPLRTVRELLAQIEGYELAPREKISLADAFAFFALRRSAQGCRAIPIRERCACHCALNCSAAPIGRSAALRIDSLPPSHSLSERRTQEAEEGSGSTWSRPFHWRAERPSADRPVNPHGSRCPLHSPGVRRRPLSIFNSP